MVYYNEHDPKLAPWLYELMAAGEIALGIVDTRSIEDVTANDLRHFSQHHFFAGIGGWSAALRLAGWPDDRPVWTGSCPCQPFSAAGKGGGFDDERHLWPAWHWLIAQLRPSVVFGEQVASKDGLNWLDLVQTDLEAAGYAFGAVDLCAAGLGAPHIRQRLWFVADSGDERRHGQHVRLRPDSGRRYTLDVLEVAGGCGADRPDKQLGADGSDHGVMGDAERQSRALGVGDGRVPGGPGRDDARQAAERTGVHVGAWSTVDWVACRDGKARPVEPGTFPLAYGLPGRVGQLRGYGNAIVPQVAAAFIESYLEL